MIGNRPAGCRFPDFIAPRYLVVNVAGMRREPLCHQETGKTAEAGARRRFDEKHFPARRHSSSSLCAAPQGCGPATAEPPDVQNQANQPPRANLRDLWPVTRKWVRRRRTYLIQFLYHLGSETLPQELADSLSDPNTPAQTASGYIALRIETGKLTSNFVAQSTSRCHSPGPSGIPVSRRSFSKRDSGSPATSTSSYPEPGAALWR